MAGFAASLLPAFFQLRRREDRVAGREPAMADASHSIADLKFQRKSNTIQRSPAEGRGRVAHDECSTGDGL